MDIVSKHLTQSLATNMYTPFKDLDGKHYDDMMQFMRALIAVGFTDEFDNGAVMRTIWRKIEEVSQAAGKDRQIYLTTKLETNPIHKFDLIVTFHAKECAEATATMVLFVRNDRVAVSSNVITEEVPPIKPAVVIPSEGICVYWFEAEQLFKANPRFNKQAFASFKAVYKSIAPRGDETACRVLMVTKERSLKATFKLHGEAILTVYFNYTN